MCPAVGRGGGGGGGANLLENMAVLQLFTLGGLGACSPRKFLYFKCSEAHSQFILRHTERHIEFLEKRLITLLSLFAELLELETISIC